MKLPRAEDLAIDRLGPCAHDSPLKAPDRLFIGDDERVLACSMAEELQRCLDDGIEVPAFERAGPRRKIFFDPGAITCGIVTCGGLCPGLNDVIRSLVLTLHFQYGVQRILGFRYGYAGLSRSSPRPPLELSPLEVDSIHEAGGTLLGSSRGPQDPEEMVAVLQEHGVNVLFTIGGDGTLRGASRLAEEVARQGLPISVIGIPKTIDNDLKWTTLTFGFTTAVEEARRSIVAAHCEARGAWNGVGIVKLMGRDSGFIAAHATLANADVNFCLVPEVPFDLEGPGGFLATLEKRLAEKHHAVVVIAEGAAQDLLQDSAHQERDASGNVKLKDVGTFLRDRIRQYLAASGRDCTVKYLDPSYSIRSLPANATDSQLCLVLGQHAAHAAMSGRTNMVVASWNRHFTNVPIAAAVDGRRQLDPQGPVWCRVLEATGQPLVMQHRD